MEPICQQRLRQLVNWNFSSTQMAKWVGVSHWKIIRKMKQFNIPTRKFRNNFIIEDRDLIKVIENVLANKPNICNFRGRLSKTSKNFCSAYCIEMGFAEFNLTPSPRLNQAKPGQLWGFRFFGNRN